MQVPTKVGEEKGVTLWLVVSKHKDAFMDLRAVDGGIAATVSDAVYMLLYICI